MSETVNVVNVYEVTGMPERTENRENVVVDSFSVKSIHLHDKETGRYFLMRVTGVKPVDGIGIRKLEPENVNDMSVINELVQCIARNEPDWFKP